MRQQLPNRRESETFNFEAEGGLRYVASVSHFPDGSLGEIFLNCQKITTAADVNARDAAIVFSIAIQHGTPVNLLRRALTRGLNGKASGPLGQALDILEGEING